MATKLIKIDDLKPGMFLAELDISWIKSPFFRHKRLINKQEDIYLLKAAGVKECKIDLSKSDLSETKKSSKSVAVSAPENKNEKVVKPKTQEVAAKPLVPLKKEMKAANDLRKNVIAAVQNINKSVEAEKPITLDEVTPVVEKTLESLERNDQALITLLHQSREHTKLASHTFGVFTLTMLISVELDFDAKTKDQLGMAALLHDAGWSKLPNNLLGKGKIYSPNERKLIRQHLPIVEKVLTKSTSIPVRVKRCISQHHELCDGSGYPKKLKALSIDPWAKILAVCDHYDEMVHGLGEAPGVTPQKALSDIFQMSKVGKLDQDIVARLVRIMGVYPLGSAVLLSTGEKGIITEMNREDTLCPKVLVVYDSEGAKKKRYTLLDLSSTRVKEKQIKVEKVLNISDPGVDPEHALLFTPEAMNYSE